MDPFSLAAVKGAAGQALSRLGGQQLADKLADVLHLQRAEIEMLKALDCRLDQIIAAPLRTAGRLIEDASRPKRSDEDRIRLLHEARESLTVALAQDDDPFRLSMAALLLAAVWIALDYPDDAALRLQEAHEHAIDAAQRRLADRVESPAVPSRPRRLLGRVLALAMPGAVIRANVHGRPRSVRLETTQEITVFGRPIVRIERYTASKPALRRERELVAFDDYVRTLRELRISTGENPEAVPQHAVALSPGVAGTTRTLGARQSVVLYALTYDRVEPGSTEARGADGDALPSEQMARVRVQVTPKRDQDV